jgi:hypothetical protein
VQQIELERQRLANECYQLKVANGNFLKIIETQDKNRIALEERIKDLESIVANKDAAIEDSINKRLKVIVQLDKAEELLKDLDVEIRLHPPHADSQENIDTGFDGSALCCFAGYHGNDAAKLLPFSR